MSLWQNTIYWSCNTTNTTPASEKLIGHQFRLFSINYNVHYTETQISKCTAVLTYIVESLSDQTNVRSLVFLVLLHPSLAKKLPERKEILHFFFSCFRNPNLLASNGKQNFLVKESHLLSNFQSTERANILFWRFLNSIELITIVKVESQLFTEEGASNSSKLIML